MAKCLLRRPAVEARTGMSRSFIYNGMAAGTFPRPIRLGPNSVAWVEDEVEAWIEKTIRHGRVAA